MAHLKVVLSIDPIKFPLTGIGRYTYELAAHLQNEALENLCFLHGRRLSRDLPPLIEAGPMSQVPAWKKWIQQRRLAVAIYRSVNPALKSRALKGLEDHLFHGPNYYLPPFGGRSIVTIHDLSPYVWTRSHPPERVRYMQSEMQLTLKRAAAIITDSNYVRDEVVKYFNWSTDRIFVVPLASGREFVPRPLDVLADALRPLGLSPHQYTLFTGTVEPRKNLGALLDAYASLPMQMRSRWPLVIAGYRGWESAEIHQRLQQAQREGWAQYLGFVPHHTLPALMAGARLFVYPSHYEGFGLPVLEAMACGVPVVCSNASSLPEISGKAAATHHPEDIDTLIQLLSIGLSDEQWRAKAKSAGLEQAERFSWHKCARETLAVYNAVAPA